MGGFYRSEIVLPITNCEIVLVAFYIGTLFYIPENVRLIER